LFADASPAQVRAALIPEETVEFDQQWREVMARATETLDLAEVLETLESWRRVARLTAAAGAEAHREMYRRAAARLTGEDVPADEPLRRTKARLGL
jgi:ribosomal protein L12E/L44/L45/RPP1/RPP2